MSSIAICFSERLTKPGLAPAIIQEPREFPVQEGACPGFVRASQLGACTVADTLFQHRTQSGFLSSTCANSTAVEFATLKGLRITDAESFVSLTKASGKQITFLAADNGDHYQSMIDQGIPAAVEWIQKQ